MIATALSADSSKLASGRLVPVVQITRNLLVRQTSVIVALTFLVSAAKASEYQVSENLAAVSAQEVFLGLDGIDKEKERRPSRQIFEDLLAQASPFWRDSVIDLRLRAFDFQRDNDIMTIADAFAVGSELTFASGKWRDKWSLVGTWHTSSAIDAPEDLGGTGILAPDQSNLSVISRAYLQYDFPLKISARFYRQDFNLPYINRQDSRMIPNTHEAYVAQRVDDRFEFVIGHITKMKKRDSEEFVPMGEIAGVPGDDSGTSIAGARVAITPNLNIGAMVQQTVDLFTTVYSETSYKRTISDLWGVQLAAQATNQKSNGDELLGDFDTYSWGVRGALSYRGAILTLAHTSTDRNAAIRRPFGGTPGFTSSMLFNFDRAGERATRVGLSQNFETYNLPGVSLIVNYTEGRDAVAPDGAPLPNAREIAITADFRPQETWLKGLWLRVRYAEADRGSAVNDRRDLRIILNYNLSALR